MQAEYKSNIEEFCGVHKELIKLYDDYMSGKEERGYPFAYATAGGEQGFCSAMTHAYRDRVARLSFLGGECTCGEMRLKYRSDCENLEFQTTITNVCGSFIQKTSVKNTGDSPVILTAIANQLRFGRYGDVFPDKDYELLYCNQTWYNEGQWRRVRLSEAGITDYGTAPPTGSFEINGLSSQTTARYFPNIYLLDTRRNVCCYCELEPIGKWHMSLGLWRGWWTKGGEIVLTCGCAEDRSLQFVHKLMPNETYCSAECVFGAVDGGVEEAVKHQYAYRRQVRNKISEMPPVVFNDYMNCLWGEPEEEKCLRLASAAKACGAQVFTVDAGWFGNKKQGWSEGLGEWRYDSDRFDGGIVPFIRKITASGLTAGLWFELECCAARVAEKLPRDWFVTYKGKLFGNSSRKFFDFRNANVREYLLCKLKPLFDAGIRYIKNDYNDGYYALGEEGTYGLQENLRAFYAFIDELYRVCPDLIIENCASGAMRSDGETLKHFAVQSISDQDDYRLYPSIVKGSLLNGLPEQLGIWCMPHPVHCSERKISGKPADIISYNFVSAFAGIPCVSGRLDLCDEEEIKLIKSGIELYKKRIAPIKNKLPQFPLGVTKRTDWDALVLSGEEEKLLFVWRLEGALQTEIPYKGVKHVEQLFPFDLAETHLSQDQISICLKHKYTAALFSVK